MFFGKKGVTTIAIIGPAGTGKSQLALEVAHRTRQRYKNWSVFWIDASDMDSLYRSYASIAQKLEIPNWDDNKADSRLLVKAYLSRKGERQYLLVFDNMDDVSLESSGISTGALHLSDYLPQSELCSIIYTTTNSDIAKRLAGPNVVKLKEMTSSTAQKMLENHIQSPLSRSEQQEAQLLLHELSYLPLAIVQATAYINTRNITIQEYRSQVDRQREAVLRRSNELPEEYDTTGPVTATLLISLHQIRGDGELAADYLFLAACVDRRDIPLDLLPASSAREREEAIKVLSSYGLVTRRPAESSLDLHQLVHRALRGWLQKQEWLDEWTVNSIRQMYRVFPGNDHSSRSKWRRLLPHARYILSHSAAEQDGGDRLGLALKSAMALYNDGRWKEAEELEVQVMETSSRVLGDEHLSTLTIIANLASTYRDQGLWKEAEKLFVQVMETRKRVLGDKHPDTLKSMNNLAFTLKGQGLTNKAILLIEDCCRLRAVALGSQHPFTISSRKALTTWQLEAMELSKQKNT
jgi:hypothetical protein